MLGEMIQRLVRMRRLCGHKVLLERFMRLQRRLMRDLLDSTRIQVGQFDFCCVPSDRMRIVYEAVEDQRVPSGPFWPHSLSVSEFLCWPMSVE